MAANTLHILLAISVFFSTTGFSVNRHFCQNELKNTALFVKSGGCHQAEHKVCFEYGHCTAHKNQKKKNCCNDQSDYYKLEQEKQAQPKVELLKKPALIAAVVSLLHGPFSFSDSNFLTEKIFKPPIVCDDFQSLLQTYRL